MGARSSFRIEQAKVLLRSGSTVREAAQAVFDTAGPIPPIPADESVSS